MESRFQHDFSGVRVHTGDEAAASARGMNALAYSVGPDLVFGAGQYTPSTPSGRELLAHELAHVVQQPQRWRGGALEMGDRTSTAEKEAEATTRGVSPPHCINEFSGARAVIRRAPVPGNPKTTPADYGIALVVVDHGATDAAAAARERLNEIYSHLQPANLAQLQSDGVTAIELHIVPEDTKLIDLPEFKNLKGTKTPDGRLWDDVRGAGGSRDGSVIRYAVAQENLVGSKHQGHGAAIGLGILGGVLLGLGGAGLGVLGGGKDPKNQLIGGIAGGIGGAALGATLGAVAGNALDQQDTGYAPAFLASHEGTHVVELFALTPAQHTEVTRLYDIRKKANGPWLAPADYTSSNVHEYWAQCSSAFFRRPYENQYADSYTPEWLQKNDPGMYRLLVEVYGAPSGAEKRAAGGGHLTEKAAA
ncbi:MAG: hypothetical protein C5B51_27265 [Terriglobia bacterium]|nr:MAG: hypothetical protein C5B51_27265 [Terriglobia bacterium]